MLVKQVIESILQNTQEDNSAAILSDFYLAASVSLGVCYIFYLGG